MDSFLLWYNLARHFLLFVHYEKYIVYIFKMSVTPICEYLYASSCVRVDSRAYVQKVFLIKMTPLLTFRNWHPFCLNRCVYACVYACEGCFKYHFVLNIILYPTVILNELLNCEIVKVRRASRK